MNSTEANPYRTWGLVAAEADAGERASFIRQTYLHLCGAILAFIALEAVLLNSPLAERMTELMVGNGRVGWLVVLGAFIGVSWLANSWASSSTSTATQYLGLSLYVVAEAVIFVPLLYFASVVGPENVIVIAGLLTAFIFVALTGVVFITGADFSFLRTLLSISVLAAFGVIACSLLFGFSLGIVFTGFMLLLAGGYILYDTSNVLHHYRVGQHVAASLALFASVALMFWYLLQLLMSLNNRR
ncbi:MAG: US12 family protein [Pirellulales bacterium]|nr:US12 family protein [Pirellulales bacterium]